MRIFRHVSFRKISHHLGNPGSPYLAPVAAASPHSACGGRQPSLRLWRPPGLTAPVAAAIFRGLHGVADMPATPALPAQGAGNDQRLTLGGGHLHPCDHLDACAFILFGKRHVNYFPPPATGSAAVREDGVLAICGPRHGAPRLPPRHARLPRRWRLRGDWA